MAIALSGSLVITGSIFATQGITGSFSGNATSASYADTLQGLGSASFAPAATFNTVSQSYATASGSLSTRVTNLESTSSTVSSSFATTSGSIAGRVTTIEGQYATTGSNIFTGPQYVNQASNAIGFASTASLYTDGGLRVTKDSFVSGTAYFNNVVVYGTSSIQYITSSQVNFGTNIITVNTDTPAVRFGGLSVFDSGSTQLTGSILWDSQNNHWIYSNPSGSSYNSAMLMNGPRNTGSLGNEQGTTNNALMKGQGGDHITSSQVIDDGTTVRIPGALQVTGSLVGSSTAAFSDTVTISKAAAISSLIIKGSSSTTGLWLYLNGLNATLSNQDNGSLAFQTNGTDRLTISSAGAASFTSNVNIVDYSKVTGAGPWFSLFDTQGSSKNWAIRAGQEAVGDLAIRQSNSTGGDPVNAGTTRLYISAAGNLGLGVIPSAWNTVTPIFQIGYTAFSAYLNTQAIYSSNAVYTSGWKYISNGAATYYSQNETGAGEHAWKIAPSGTAGNAISFTQAMTLNSSGRLLVGSGVTDNGASIQTNGDIRADYSSAIYLQINGGATGDYRKGFSGINQETSVARGLHIFNYDPDSSQGIKFYGGTYNAKVRFGGFDSGGNFFVNATDSAAGYKFYVNGTAGITGAATFSSSVTANSIGVGNNTSGFGDVMLISNTNANVYPRVNRSSTSYEAGWKLSTGGTDSWYLGLRSTDGVGSYHFYSYTTNSSVVQITSGGNVLIGTTSVGSQGTLNSYTNNANPAGRFISGPSTPDGNIVLMVDKYSSTNTTSQWFLGFTISNQGVASGVITANGASQAAFGSWSDRRLKENITDLEPQLHKILALRPVEFDYIQSEGGGHQISFIAQEFEEVYPDAVGERQDGMKTLTGWSKTEARLVKAIQEQQAQIEALKARIETLEK